jgi:hypothetical protein
MSVRSGFSLTTTTYMVEEVLDQWHGPSDMFFRVRADDGNLYILRQDRATPDGVWRASGSSATETRGGKIGDLGSRIIVEMHR